MTFNGHCLVLACPGSGKTAVLRGRAIRKLKLNPKVKGLGVTFSKDAAKELEHRVLSDYPDAAGSFTVGTFHSLCKRQLNEAGIEVNLVNEVQQMAFIKSAWMDVMAGRNLYTLEDVRVYIEAMKAQVDPVLGDPKKDPRVQVYLRYEEMLRQRGLMDFSDMLLNAVKKMDTGEVKPWRVGWILVDEAQDCDMVQMRWALSHQRRNVELTVVGDDDQSIFSWRSAGGLPLLNAFRAQTGAALITLNTTYRCPQEVIRPAGRLIALNRDRLAKQLRTENMTRGAVKRVVARDATDEVELMVEAVLESGEPWEWGILARSNSILNKAEKLIGDRFPVTRSSGRSFWELKYPSIYLAIVRSIARDDLLGIDFALRLTGVPETRLSQIHGAFGTRDRGSLTRYLKDASPGVAGEPGFKSVARQWRILLAQGRVEAALKGVELYLVGLGDRLIDRRAGKSSSDMLNRAKSNISTSFRIISSMRGPIHQRLRLIDVPDAGKVQEEDEGLEDNAKSGPARLMTLHGSKGLEFKHVWMLGCDAGIIPSRGSVLEEERRLFYVGMTRSKERLFLSHGTQHPSVFLTECGILD